MKARSSLRSAYKASSRQHWCFFSLLLLGATAASLLTGPMGAAVVRLSDPAAQTVLLLFRLPRTLAALLCGGGMALTGAVMQGLFRNPLADPGVTGASACALPPAIAVIYYGGGHPGWVSAAAAAGAAAGGALLYALCRRQSDVTAPLLLGAAINAAAGAVVMGLLARAPDPYALSDAVFWSFGGLNNRTPEQVAAAAVFIPAGAALLLPSGPALARLTFGDDASGISLRRLRRRVLLGSALVIGGCTAAAGPMVGVGLFIPHAVRAIGGAHPARVVVFSAASGALFVMVIDTLMRLCGSSLPIGVVTAPFGAAVLLALAVRGRR